MKKKAIFKWLIIVLSLHILSVQTGLLHGLGEKNKMMIFALIFALPYSAASGFIIYLSEKKWLIFLYALADALGVGFYYMTNVILWIIVLYFSLYTFLLIFSIVFIDKNEEGEKELPEQVKKICQLIDQGKTRDEISKKLSISKHIIWKLLREHKIKQ